jgi:protein MpaA
MKRLVSFLVFIGTISRADTSVADLMTEIKNTYAKTKWSDTLFKLNDWKMYEKKTKEGRPLVYFVCGENKENTTLLLSSVHGDEVTPIYYGLRLVSWIKGEPDICKKYRVVVAPLVNPDGALKSKPTRTNSNGVDLNRNFPTEDFSDLAIKKWKTDYKSDPRRYPGEKAASEIETQFQMWLIDEFKPNKILTVHSPLNFFDYDGPEDAVIQNFTKEYLNSCKNLKLAVKKASGTYNFLKFGYFPGSLGHYSGKEKGVPTLTLELPSTDAGRAKQYFEMLKKGLRALIMHKIEGQSGISAKN